MEINVNWVDGKEKPIKAGSYYIILQAKQDVKAIFGEGIEFRPGDLVMRYGWFSKEKGRWTDAGGDDQKWQVLLWAEDLEPAAPRELRGRVRERFGRKLGAEGGEQ